MSTIRVSNGLTTDQNWRSVGPDPDPNYFQTFQAADKSRH